MKNRSSLALLVTAFLIASSATAFALERSYVIWFEYLKSGADEYFGVRADWIDNDWSGIPCPDFDHNGVATFVNAFGEGGATGGFLQMGYVERQDRPSAAGCIHHKDYYWERDTFGAGYDIDYFMVSEAGSHQFSIRRQDNTGSNCNSPGVPYCWQFVLTPAGGTATVIETCCGDDASFNYSPEISAQIECVDHNDNQQCPATGVQDTLSGFQYRASGGSTSWTNWANKDLDCADVSRGMKGRWPSATSGKGSANSSAFQNTHNPACQ